MLALVMQHKEMNTKRTTLRQRIDIMSDLRIQLTDSTIANEQQALMGPKFHRQTFSNETNLAKELSHNISLLLDVDVDGEDNYILGYN